MSQQNNSTNTLHVRYYQLDRYSRRIFRKKLSELCNLNGEKTLYKKLRPEYTPSPIEDLASKMIVDEILHN